VRGLFLLSSVRGNYDKCHIKAKRNPSPRSIRLEVLMLAIRSRFTKILFFIFCRSLSALFFFLIPGCLGSGFVREAAYIPGAYEGTGSGYRGPIHVEVEVSHAGIEDITITGHSEGAFPGGAAMEELLEAVLETGSTELDAVSGATFSSAGFLEAVEDALEKAAAPE
jgi:hypothetical protein